ncbi:tripartite tricarboxylate transporter substrate binding protein [uncultured Enterovirga sp.]|uniref:tripartite tricarboxylate transporter substrate binding protein n=1 Tax=uncultured Enterovirga sp. TaxID=2026352 RepID=UPI0035CA2ECC
MGLVTRAAAALGMLLAWAGAAQAFPDRPVTIIVPWAAGGGADTVTRYVAAGLQQELGVPVNVVNRTGGGGLTGHSAMANAAPDGYTLGVASPEIAFYKALGLGEFTPDSLDLFSRVALLPAGVTVKADSPWTSLDDLLRDLKAKPKGTYTSSGTGTGGSWHIAMGGLLRAAGLEADRIRWVPSQGGAPALQDLAAGGLTMFTGAPAEAKAMLDAGRVRTIAIMSEQRSPSLPNVPTLMENKIDWAYSNWFALVAPKGIPADRRARIAEAAQRAMARPDVQDGLKGRGIQPVWDAPGVFPDYLKGFVARGEAVLGDLGLAKR